MKQDVQQETNTFIFHSSSSLRAMSLHKAGAGLVIALTLASLLIPSYASGAPRKRKRSVGEQQYDVVQDNGDLLRVFKKQEEYRYLVGNAQLLKPEHIKAAYHLMQKEQPKSELKKKIDEGLKTVQHPETVRNITSFANVASELSLCVVLRSERLPADRRSA